MKSLFIGTLYGIGIGSILLLSGFTVMTLKFWAIYWIAFTIIMIIKYDYMTK